MLMVPPYLGAAAASHGAPAASTPAAVPASTSRRVNGAARAGTRVPASETNKAMILLLAAPLLEPCRKRTSGMRACQHNLSGSSRKPRRCVRAANGGYHPSLGDPGGLGQCRKRGMKGGSRRQGRAAGVGFEKRSVAVND